MRLALATPALLLPIFLLSCGGDAAVRDAASAADAGRLDAGRLDAGRLDAGPLGDADAGLACIDEDGDGYGEGCPAGADCAPLDPDIHPGAIEECDGVDNDCSGAADEGCTCTDGATRPCGRDTGACIAGEQLCASGSWATCVGEVGPAVESCDGVNDEDCDGTVDEGCAPTSVVSAVDSRQPRLDVDAAGRPHIVYYWWTMSSGSGLAHARWSGSAWMIDDTVPQLLGPEDWAFAIDEADRPTTLQCDGTTAGRPVVVVTLTSSGWTTETVSSSGETCGQGVALFVDGSGRLHAFAKTGGSGRERLSHYRRSTAGVWTTLPTAFDFDRSAFLLGPMDVTQAPDGTFHAIVSRSDRGGPFLREIRYKYSVPGGWWLPEVLPAVTSLLEERFVAVDMRGVAHVTNGQQGTYFARRPGWGPGRHPTLHRGRRPLQRRSGDRA